MSEASNTINTFMEMDLYLQIAIPSGYLGYLLSQYGLRQKEKVIDVIFISSVFGMISLLTWNIVGIGHSICPTCTKTISFLQILLAILTPILFALLWRNFFRSWLMEKLHKCRISNKISNNSTWMEIVENPKVAYSQVTVFLKNGEAVTCDDIYDFKAAPISSMSSDEEGNIALYITKRRPRGKKEFTEIKPLHKDKNEVDFYYLTYIPKKEIEAIEFVTNHPNL